MTKTVFDNHMVAHVWAQRTQDSGRSHNGNFHFDGDTIYSYRTPIGRLVDTATGLVALVTSETFSITTSGKHMGPIRSALDYGRFIPMYHVPFVTTSGLRTVGPDQVNEANLKHIENCYYSERQRLLKSSGRQSWALDGLRASYETRVQFALAFELDYTTRDVDADIAELNARWDRLEAKRNDPAYIAKRERECAKRAERELAKHESSVADYRAKLEQWRNGEIDDLPQMYLTGMSWRKERELRDSIIGQNIILRVRGENVETSRGASVPVSHAKRAWPAIKHCRETKSTWQRNGHAIHVGQFQFYAIDAEGNVKAGCHFVRFEELARLAVTLGLESEVAS